MTMTGTKPTLEQVDALYQFLTGRIPVGSGIEMGRGGQPKLTPRKAFAVIWFLQEHLHILPDCYEACTCCGNLFDSDCAGHLCEQTGKSYCDNCDCGNG
jgi:hypothetical protein